MRTGRGVAVVAILAGVMLTPRLVPGHPVAQAVDRAVNRALSGVEQAVTRAVGQATDVRVADAYDGSGAASQDPFRWTGTLAEGSTIEVRGVAGAIIAVPGKGDQVVVVAERSARRSDPDEVRIEVVEHRGGVTVCAVYPTPRGDADNRCGPGGEYRNSVRNNDVSVRFHVEVPEGVELAARTVNGDVEATDLLGDVEAETVNGDVELTTRGFARAATVNGSIRAEMGRWLPEGADFRTVNGSIELDLPDDVDADLDASWVNGALDSDLPLLVDGKIGRRSVVGRLGAGGSVLRIHTVNGSIRIR